VIEAIPGLSLKEVKPFYERLEKNARKAMEAVARRANEDAPAAGRVLVYGRRAEEIVKYAAENEVDLIVLASHRVNPWKNAATSQNAGPSNLESASGVPRSE